MAWYDVLVKGVEGVVDSVGDGFNKYVANEVNDLISPSAYEVAATAQAEQEPDVAAVGAAAAAAEASENEPVWMGFNQKQLMIGGGITLAVILFATRS